MGRTVQLSRRLPCWLVRMIARSRSSRFGAGLRSKYRWFYGNVRSTASGMFFLVAKYVITADTTYTMDDDQTITKALVTSSQGTANCQFTTGRFIYKKLQFRFLPDVHVVMHIKSIQSFTLYANHTMLS